MAPSIEAFGLWLNDSVLREHVRTLLRAHMFVSPTVQSLHILSFSAVVGTAGMIALRLVGLGPASQDPQEMARRLYPWTWTAMAVLLLTGGALFLNRPLRYLDNEAFQAKVVMLAIALGLTLVLQHGLRAGGPGWSAPPPRRAAGRLMAGASLALWIGIILAGRLIAYAPF